MKKILSLFLIICLLVTIAPMEDVYASSYKDWKQSSGPWKNYKLGNSSCTISSSGCTSTALAMAAVRLGCESEQNFDPGVFVTRMNKAGGYTNGGSIYWSKISSAVPNMSMVGHEIKFSNESESTRYNTIAENINKGYAVIITILRYTDTYKHWHYVLADSVSNGVLNIIDPGGNNGNIKNKYKNAQVPVYSIRCFKNNNKTPYTEPVTPPVQTHTHAWGTAQTQQGHPHPQYRACSCGDTYFVGNATLSSCSSCYPLGNVKFSRSFKKTEGEVTFYRGNGENITSYTITLYKNGSYYNTYNMTSTEKTLSNMPSGKYSATLTTKNSNTGQQKNIYCDDFEFKETYNINYNANGGSDAPSTDEKIQDVDKTLSSKTPTRAHYIFKGWAKSKNATTPKYSAGDKYTSNANITLYAVWEPEIYTVSFDANGGKGELESVTVTYGNKIKLPNSVIFNSKYLKGWSTNKSATSPEIKPGGEFSPVQNTTFYAVWGSSTWDNEVSASLSGSGTESDPYKIASAADLAYLANKVNSATSAPEYKYYILTDNISINYEEWVPIGLFGNENQYFHGSFDGNGYRISNFYVTNVNEGYVGIFGYAKDSVFKNVNVSGIIENISSDNAVFAGPVSGYARNTAFENCEALYVNISGVSASDSEPSYMGCIVGKTEGGSIKGCTVSESHINLKAGDFEAGLIAGYSSAEIESCNVKSTSAEGLFSTSTGVGDFKIGGICGNLSGNANKCSVNALLFSNAIKTTATSYAGGIAGYLSGKANVCSVIFSEGDEKNIDNDEYNSSMYVSGNGSYSLGGIAGFQDGSASITDCKYDGQSVSGITSSGSVSVGGFSGTAKAKTNPTVSVSGGQTLSYAALPKRDGYKATWYTDAAMKTPYDFSQTVTSNLTLYAKWEKGEEEIDIWDGSSKEPAYNASTKTYTITNGEELAWISDVSNGVITSGTNFPTDISFSGYTIELANDIYLNDISNFENWETTPPKNSWKPIGTFAGRFDGKNETINGMYLQEIFVGVLFRYVSETGIVQNTSVQNSYISSHKKSCYIGIITGENSGYISNCRSINNIICNIEGGYCGGIVGLSRGGNIVNCYNSSTIKGNCQIGGICGKNEETTNISNCVNVGIVNGFVAGGICGSFHAGKINSCYNHGSISGTGDTGGIVGFASDYEYSNSRIEIYNCHNNGTIAGETSGGIVGYNDSGKITYCYSIGSVSGNTYAAIAGLSFGSSKKHAYLGACYAPSYTLYNLYTDNRHLGDFHNTELVSYKSLSSMKNLENLPGFTSNTWVTNSDINDGYPYLKTMEETYKTYVITTIEDIENSAIKRSFTNIDGILYSEGTTDVNAGGAIGSIVGSSGASSALNLMTITSRVSSKTSGTSYMANSGYLAGNNKNGLYSFANAYYGSGMDISAVNSGKSSNVYTNDEGTARSQLSINSVFYTKTLGLNPYVSVANTESDSTAVWVLNDGELPELYYNCLNDITISKDIENGTVILDKEKAVNGESVTVTATPNEGYVLNKIYVNGAEVIDENHQFTVSGSSEVYVTFAEKIPQYSVEIEANENADASLTNADNTAIQLLSTATTLTASDGDEILVNVGTDEKHVLDTIFVNGEEIVSDSFILTENSTVSMQVADISTDIKAETYDAANIGSHEVTLSGSITDSTVPTLKYIRYWRADTPDVVYTTTAEEGSGEYTVDLTMLEANTTYNYQMTENGAIKSFTTEEEYIVDFSDEEIPEDNNPTEPAESVTTTTITKLLSGYRISITASQSLAGKKIIVAFYNTDNALIGVKIISGTAETAYSEEIGGIIAAYAKVYVADLATLIPLATAEPVTITN